jgi:predicted flap endonuclease-1-like 5' DNA nuclease
MRPGATEQAAPQSVADERTRLRAEAASWRARVPKLVEALDARKRELERRVAEVAGLETELAAQVERNRKLQETVGLAERQIGLLGEDLEQLARTVRTAEARAAAAERALANVRAGVAVASVTPTARPADASSAPVAPAPDTGSEARVDPSEPPSDLLVSDLPRRSRDVFGVRPAPGADRTVHKKARLDPASAMRARDALTRVRGIGERLAERLARADIVSLHDLAALDLVAAARPEHPLHDLLGRARREDWVGQASCFLSEKSHEKQQ